jgi:hypothetical protein
VAKTPDITWHFQCPHCGFGHAEVGHLVDPDEIYCVICLEEETLLVRLHRWEPTGDHKDQARLREGRSAA